MNVSYCRSTVFVLLLINTSEVHAILARSDYPQLISDVHHLYGTSSVVIAHNEKVENVVGIAPMFEIVQWLSNSGIPSLVTDIRQLLKVQSYYRGHIKRDLHVVFLRTHECAKEFENIMKKIILSQSIWLIIFRPFKNEFILREYCNIPLGNPFNVKFDTEMLIKCYDEEILREWYSMYENVTSVFDLATWNPINRLKLLNTESLYRRRMHIGGVSLRIVSVNGSPLISEGKDSGLGGLFGDVMRELSSAVNFKIRLIGKQDEYGTWNNNTKKWNGIIEQLHMNKADLAAADMIMSSRRLDIVDFSIPIITSRLVLFFKEPTTTGVQQLGYFLPFSNEVWIMIMLLILSTPILLTLIKMKTEQTNNISNLLSENYLNVWGIYCQQGLPEFPTITSLRLAYFSIFISALILSSVYSAVLISYLTVPRPILPFTTLEEFVDDGTYNLIVLKHSTHQELFEGTTNPLLKKMKKLMKDESKLPLTGMDAVNQLCSSKTAFFSSEITIDTSTLPSHCQLTWIKAGDINCLALPLKKRSQYTGIINYHLKRFIDNGMLQHFRQHARQSEIENSNTNNDVEVTLFGVAPILFIVIGGIALSALLLTAEKIYISYNKV